METLCFGDGNITDLIDSRTLTVRHDLYQGLQMHSSLIRRLSLEKELEGHQGCVNTLAWNSEGSLLISGSDDTRINIWSYSRRQLLHSIESGHSANIFCTKFVPETSDELVVSGAADAEVRLFNLSHPSVGGNEESSLHPSALFQCHTRRVKKLAVESGNPNMVWSASEDGTLRQHDFREGASCPPAGSSHQECRNILLDLRCGAKKSLADPPKQSLALKSCDISATRPHLLIVGGSDAFARLYDRRMLPPLSSAQKKLSPPPCVKYFCPMHLSDRGRAGLHLTHVAFGPDGEEVLLSYSGEHVYLMDVNPAHGSAMRYTTDTVLKLYSSTSMKDGSKLTPLVSDVFPTGFPSKAKRPVRLDKCQELLDIAKKSLKEGTDYYFGIEACNDVLHDHGHEIGPTLMHEYLCVRAALLLKRKWKNDAHMAVRDCQMAREIDSGSFQALQNMAEALSQLGKYREALDFAVAAQSLGCGFEISEMVDNIKKKLDAENEKSNKANDGAPKSGSGSGRVLSLSDILYHSDASSDASHPGSEREYSDYDEELEVDFETSVSGDEGRDPESGNPHRSLHFRIHRKGDSTSNAGHTNSSCGSQKFSTLSDGITYRHDEAIDLKQRYVGHCNIGTDIKQASFLGQKGEFLASGSDDGRWFIWEKRTGRLIKMLMGDEAVVNCVQCHPVDSVVATSGIDSTIKLWSPLASVPSIVAGGPAGPEIANVLDVMEGNQRRLSHNGESLLPLEILEGFRMHEFPEGSLRPFECIQS